MKNTAHNKSNRPKGKKKATQKRPAKRPLKKNNKKKLQKKKRRIKRLKVLFGEIALTVVVTIGVVYLFSLFTFSFAKVEGYSMSDTLEDNDVVVINKLAKIKRFDLVYIHVPESKDKSVRRIIGQPGESLYYKNGQLFINEKEKEERFIAEYKNQFEKDGMMFTEDFTLKSLTGEPTIPKDKYLVLGDNRPYATDSRYYRLVDKKEIIGTVEMRILPLHTMQRF